MFGPKRLPELGRALGHGMRGFKDALSGEDEVELPPGSTTAPSPGAAHIAQPLDLQEDPVTAAGHAPAATTESAPAATTELAPAATESPRAAVPEGTPATATAEPTPGTQPPAPPDA